MAKDDESGEDAVGAEKSPRNVLLFAGAALLGLIVLFSLVLVLLHFHTPVVQH